MAHVFFFSYADADKDQELEAFFEDLCSEVRVQTGLKPKDPKLCFRDGMSIPLMTEWKPALMDALQTSTVLVCVTSSAYFASRFCGQEFHVFDRRRRHQRTKPAPVVFPVNWAPSHGAAGAARILDPHQWRDSGFHPDYERRGLRTLRKVNRQEYDRCMAVFGEAIASAYRTYGTRVPRVDVANDFDDIPNSFAEVLSEEALGPAGWREGPSVANFVLAAAGHDAFPNQGGRYGSGASEWRPYLPPISTTVHGLAKTVANREGLLFRQIPIDDNLSVELAAAHRRKNLSIVIADPQSLKLTPYDSVAAFDQDSWEGTAVLMPWNDDPVAWNDLAQVEVDKTFPVRSSATDRPYHRPIKTLTELTTVLERTLAKLQSAVTAAGAAMKEKSDLAPTSISGSPEAAQR